MRKIATIGTLLCASVLLVNADLADQKRRVELELRNTALPELPARAAQIVRSTPAAERSQAAIITVETIVARYPAAAPSVVASVAKAAPESSAAVVAAATRLAPEQAPSIEAAAKPKNDRGNDKDKGETGRGNENGNNGNGNGNNGNGNGNGNERPEKPEGSGRPEKSELLPNGKPRPFPHHGHTDDPNHVHQPNKYNRPKPRD